NSRNSNFHIGTVAGEQTTVLATLTLLAMGLVLTFLMAGVLQWRSDVRTQSSAAASQRMSWDMHDPSIARNIQVGALR
ncbi:MAG: hypothetical protein WCP68_20700, partial [Enhydrobacter sp.]